MRRRGGTARTVGSRFGLVIMWGVVVAVFSFLRPDTFMTAANFQTIFSSQAVLLILTLALLPALAAGEYDLSVAGVLGLSLVLIGWLNVIHGWPIGWAVAVALGAGLVVGLTNAAFIVGLGIDSLIVTLGMGTLLAGTALGINNLSVGGVSDTLVSAMRTEFLGFQMAFFYGLILTALMWYVFAYTPVGRYLFFVGAGRSVARLSGIRVERFRAGTLVLSGVLSALAGVVLAGILGSADPIVGPTFLLPAFASAFLGATAITPGRINPWGAFIAVYFLLTGITGLQLIGLSGWITQVFYGGSLVIAVTLSRLAAGRRDAG